MHAPDSARRPSPAAAGLPAILLAALLLGTLVSPLFAQTGADAVRAALWESVAADAEKQIADPSTSTAQLEILREQLARQRAESVEAEQANAPIITELNGRLQALGPPPAEGATEAPEIAERRKDLNDQIAKAQVPILEAQEAYQRINGLIQAIDAEVRARFSAELRSQGPSPLWPRNWVVASHELGREAAAYRDRVQKALATPSRQETLLRRLPINILLVVAGVGLTLILRRGMVDVVERRLAVASSPRSIAWLVALRNLGRLIVPAVGAGLIFAALNPHNLVDRPGRQAIFDLPAFILVLIWAGWLGASLFATRLPPAHRLLPVDDAAARKGARLSLVLGSILSLELLLARATTMMDLTPATISVLYLPLILLGSAGVWLAAGLIASLETQLAPGVGRAHSDQTSGQIAARVLRLLVMVMRGVAVLAPVLAAMGYFAASRFLVFPSIRTLGLIGSGIVLFHLLNAAASKLLVPPDARGRESDSGLIPVVVAALVGLAALPLLALIWGARASDLSDMWTLLRDGVTFGGIRLSASAVVKLAAVLAIGIAATRLLQGLLRGSVLPRTRLDAGGRNAVLAGVGYVGFFLSGLAGISAAGLDLSNIAIVAGALSVGIGFGLQNVVSNFVSGIILLVERPIKEGDWIEVGAFSGYVRGISVRSTEIETFDRASVILPNSDLVSGTVLNRTHKGMSGRMQVPVSVTYDADPKVVEEVLLAIAHEHPLVLEDPGPRVLFMNLGPDTMDFEIRCWLRDVNYSLSARSEMNFQIVERLGVAGVRIQPYARDPRAELGPTAPAPTAIAAKPG